MATDIRTQLILEQSRKRQRLSHAPKLLPNEQVEVRSVEDGLRGSWHQGIVIERKTQIRVVKFHHLLCDKTSENLIESIQVLFTVDGNIPTNWRQSDFPNYRGKIRPKPPNFICNKINLHYGQCVDVFHNDAWWEGVVFDHNNDSDVRLIFFPDMGDELIVQFKNLRVTQDWNDVTDEWKVREDWIFLQVVEELKSEWPLLVTVKQIWYEVRITNSFLTEMKEWTCPVKENWKETIKEVMTDNFKLTMTDFLHNFSEDFDIKKQFLDSMVNLESLSSFTKEEFETQDLHVVESEYCPQAVVDYYSLISGTNFDFQKIKDDKFKNLQIRARKHLFSVGWSNFYLENDSSEKIIVYSSPNGRKFYGLCEACCHYIKEFYCFDFDFQEPPIEIEKDESLMTSKRARKDVSSMYRTPRTVLSWLIDNNIVLPRAKVKYICKKNGCIMKEGRITRDGIKCSCCQCTFSFLKFQKHGGSSYGGPSSNIFLEDGRSLLDCQSQIKQIQNEKSSLKENRNETVNDSDYICSVCQYGGELVLCDQCPSSFHKSCVGLKEVPDGEWFCPSCSCRICNLNCEQSTNSDMLNCEQCAKQYHVGCLKRRDLLNVDNNLEANWFCSSRCEEIFTGLDKILGKSIQVGRDNLTWTLRKNKTFECSNNDSSNMEELIENYSKLNVAISVMHECFEPVKEARNGRDIVEDVIFCRWSELRRLNFKGFYTVLLEKDDELISTATLRVYGEKVAEIPLVGTRFQYRRRGMCHILMHELEKILTELGVKRLVLPAVSSVLHTWTRSFGFSIMTESEKLKFLGSTFLDFQGTTMCHKILVKPCSTRNNGGTSYVEHQSAKNLQQKCYKRKKIRCFSESKCVEICK